MPLVVAINDLKPTLAYLLPREFHFMVPGNHPSDVREAEKYNVDVLCITSNETACNDHGMSKTQAVLRAFEGFLPVEEMPLRKVLIGVDDPCRIFTLPSPSSSGRSFFAIVGDKIASINPEYIVGVEDLLTPEERKVLEIRKIRAEAERELEKLEETISEQREKIMRALLEKEEAVLKSPES
jgi:hypothetical protein